MIETMLPIRNLLNEPFWAAAAEGRLVLPVCVSRNRHFWPPSPFSPFLTGGDVAWRDADPTGLLVSMVTYHRAFQRPLKERVPYAIGLVELADGVRLLAHVPLQGTDDPLTTGDRVAVYFASLKAGGEPVPHLRPA